MLENLLVEMKKYYAEKEKQNKDYLQKTMQNSETYASAIAKIKNAEVLEEHRKRKVELKGNMQTVLDTELGKVEKALSEYVKKPVPQDLLNTLTAYSLMNEKLSEGETKALLDAFGNAYSSKKAILHMSSKAFEMADYDNVKQDFDFLKQKLYQWLDNFTVDSYATKILIAENNNLIDSYNKEFNSFIGK